jgi:predicted nucleotidyltransferase
MSKTTNTFDSLLKQLKDMLPLLRAKYEVQSIEVFGSFVRGDEREDSDLDLLVTFDKVPTLFEFLELENYLSDELGIKVDLVMKDSLKPAIGERILEEAQPV